MIIDNYNRIKERCDLEYQIPVDDNFVIREFDDIKWSNAKNRNFYMIIKILAENGYCTINEIKDKDGLSQKLEDKKKRHDIYNRLIRGLDGKKNGLVDKWIIEPEDKQNWKTKRNNRYRLSLFGLLYAINLFSNDDDSVVNLEYHNQIEYKIDSKTKHKKKILDVLVDNYSDKIPLIFKRWDFLVSEFGTLVTFLVTFARLSTGTKKLLNMDAFLKPDVIRIHGWNKTGLLFSDDLSVLFFAYLARQENKYREKFEKDVELYEIYKEYIKFLKKHHNIEMLRINYHEAIFDKRYDEAKDIGVEFMEVQGMASDNWASNFDEYKW